MSTCFVIQPFDSGKFDKRFDGVYKPAIEAVDLVAYRVDRDPGVEVPIEAIEEGIKNATICLADITTDNPNVWYELGFAFASGRPVIMVCSDERRSIRYPFDIQHRTVIGYKTEAPSDFAALHVALTTRIKAMLSKTEVLRQIVEAERVTTTYGLSQHELVVLAILAGDAGVLGDSTALFSLKTEAERSGLSAIGFALALRRLDSKAFVEYFDESDFNGNQYEAARPTEAAWNFIEKNEALFVLRKNAASAVHLPDEIPF